MKRMILATMLLLGSGLAAQADMSHYTNLLKQPRGDDALAVDAQYCNERVGLDRNGVPVSAAYKRCMRGRGWRFDYTKVEKTWIDSGHGRQVPRDPRRARLVVRQHLVSPSGNERRWAGSAACLGDPARRVVHGATRTRT